MNFDRLAGLASAVGILLILTIVIAGAEPGFKLKDWQPLMAAIIALGAGTLAYRVRWQRSISTGKRNSVTRNERSSASI